MSATAFTSDRPRGASSSGARPGLARLTVFELRKMTDTRAGLWLQVGVLGITVITVAATALTGHAHNHTLRQIFHNSLQPAGILLPVVGILLVTSEWSQRTALTSFTLVPDRRRVIGAKLMASVVLAIVPLALCAVASILATALAGTGVHDAWNLPRLMFVQAFIYLATAMVTGVAFGAAFLASAPATVLYFALPIAFMAVSSAVHANSITRWLDSSQSVDPLAKHLLSGSEWAHALTTLGVWMLVPLAIGVWRVTKGEIK
jgi:ABC-2 type transport system permease protein